MKKILTLAVMALVISGGAMAQDETTNMDQGDAPNKIIKTNPIGLAFGNINLTFEMAFSNAASFEVGGNFFTKILGVDVSGFGINGGVRFYMTNKVKPAPEGFYIGPRVAFNSFTDNVTSDNVTTFGIGALLGYQWIFNSGVSLDLGAGPTYLFANDNNTDSEFSGIAPNITFAIGYAF